jgi:hypothetical protein
MMKKFIMAVFFIIASGSFGAVYLDEGFESGTLDNVTVIDGDGDTNSWEVTPTPVKGGAYYAESLSAGLTPDNTIVFPSTWVELNTVLSFWVGASDSINFAEHYAVYIADDNIDPSNFILVHEETLTSNEMKKVEIDIKPFLLIQNEWFSESNITVTVRHYNSDNQSSLLLDDMLYYALPTFWFDEEGDYTLIHEGTSAPMNDLDMRILPYDRTAYDEDWNFIGLDVVRMHYILNDGTIFQPEASIPLIINDDPDYVETYICTFPGQPIGTKMEYWFEAVDNSTYEFLGESQHFNVEWGEVSFNEGFEAGGIIPTDWTTFTTGTISNITDYEWVTWVTSNVHSGSYSATSASQNNTGVFDTEDYLVSPKLRIDGEAKLKYFVNAETPEGYKERYIVFINNVGGDSASVVNFSDTLFAETLIPGDDDSVWFERVIDLKPWSGHFVWITFKHLFTPLDKDVKLNRYLNIDDISVAELPIISNVAESGNAAFPDEEVSINVQVTDFSGIDRVTIYYTLLGQEEQSVAMVYAGDDTFSGSIPGQPAGAKCSWYAIAYDGSPYQNEAKTDAYDVFWFVNATLDWGSDYSDWPEPMNAGNKAGIDWNFGTKGNIYLNKIEVGWAYDAVDMPWSLVEFDPTTGNLDLSGDPIGAPTDRIINGIQGINTFSAGGDELLLYGASSPPIYGHVALVFDVNNYNELMLDEAGNKSHAWQWNSVSNWTTNNWGAFYIKMYVSQNPDGIENEFVSSTTELCQNYPNPFNPTTSISFYNRIAGNVSLSIYNVKGENVATLVNEKMGEGFRKIEFEASKFNSGVYYYTLRTPEKVLTKKMILVK